MKRVMMSLLLCISMIVAVCRGEYTTVNASSSVQFRMPNAGYWDCIYFGHYYQKNSSQKQKIRWRVLSKSGDDVFLISDEVLDGHIYDEDTDDCSWETSSIRNWLNTEFLNTAFNANERKAIKTTTVKNDDTEGALEGKDTQDKIYLLSLAELKNKKYGFFLKEGIITFDYSESAACSTKYAQIKMDDSGNTKAPWWLRTHSIFSGAYYVPRNRFFQYVSFNDENLGVRPVMHIELSKTDWSYAGTHSYLNGGKLTIGSTVKNKRADFKVKKKFKPYIVRPYPSKPGKILYNGSISLPTGKRVDGYEVWYSAKRKMTNKNSQHTYSNLKGAALSGLQKGKTYYVKIRPYTLYADKSVCGIWSRIKKFRVS